MIGVRQATVVKQDAMVAYREQANRAVRLGSSGLVTKRGLDSFTTKQIIAMTTALKFQLDKIERERS